MVTKAERAEMAARSEAATEGPWFLRTRQSFDAIDVMYDKDGVPCWAGKFETEADAFFVAMARSDIPRLLAHIEALEAVAAVANRFSKALVWDRENIPAVHRGWQHTQQDTREHFVALCRACKGVRKS